MDNLWGKMDPLTIATTFATIVSLIADYKSEGKDRKDDEYAYFIEWLNTNRHEKLLHLLSVNSELSSNIKQTLDANNETLLYQLQKLDFGISKIANKLDCFSGIAKSIKPKSIFSEQALLIVRQLVESGATCFIEATASREDNQYILVGCKNQKNIEYNESQFIEDDLLSLVENGLLRLDYGQNGGRLFYVTRTAALYV